MSIDATRWAWLQKGLSPAEKLVLLAMADRAGENMTCFPSNGRIHEDTGLDRKTIIAAITSLIQLRLIEDTGKRVGQTKQIRVFQLIGVECREQSQKRNSPEIGTIPKAEQSRKRNSPENGHQEGGKGPVFPAKGPKNGTRNLSENRPEKRTNQTLPISPEDEVELPELENLPIEFQELVNVYPGESDIKPSLKLYEAKRKLKTFSIARITSDILAREKTRKWMDRCIPKLSTYLDQEQWRNPIRETDTAATQEGPPPVKSWSDADLAAIGIVGKTW